MTDYKSTQKRDLLVIVIFALIVYLLSNGLDLQERIDRICDLFERFEIDEFIPVALALVPASMIYVRRRWRELSLVNLRLEGAQSEIEHLRGIMPLCCNGKKIRDDTGYWHEVEAYFKKHLDTAFTHGICNDCIKTLYPDQYRKWQDQESACQAPHNEEAT